MKKFIQGLFLAIAFVGIIIALINVIWGPTPPIPAEPDPTIQEELHAEIDRLKPYEEFVDSQNVSVVYNGCEDLRARLGLTP